MRKFRKNILFFVNDFGSGSGSGNVVVAMVDSYVLRLMCPLNYKLLNLIVFPLK